MEGEARRREGQPKRCYQCSRFEDQLWELAYQQLWRTVRSGLKRRLEDAQGQQHTGSLTLAKGA
jgi:hypothetical protein